MWPLKLEALPRLLASLWITFLMAICGTSLGIVISLPLVLFAARNLTPDPMVGFAVRNFISFCRTVPDLIWALIFVIVVGLFYTVGSVCGIAAPLAYGMLGDWVGIETTVAIATCLVLLTRPFTLALRPVVGWRATVT
jgi:phosphonate transport system permease protein